MATVTGFTAERMLEIENTTVVDGSVVGNDLILTTREGTPINAGNVRGPTGPQGAPGAVPSINDQTGATYAPRIFANKAALDLWVTAPRGAIAITTDTDAQWEKGASSWFLSTGSKVFASTTDLNNNWSNAPEGSTATTVDSDATWYKSPAGWNIDSGARVFGNVTERDSRWPTPPLGAMCVTIDTNKHWMYVSSGWRDVSYWNSAWGRVNFLTPPSYMCYPGAQFIPGAPTSINYGPAGQRLLRACFSFSIYNFHPGPQTARTWHQYSGGIPEPTVRYISIGGQAWYGTGYSVYDYISGNDFLNFGVDPAGQISIDRIYITLDDVGPVTRV